jgi:hypothetical protein
MDDSQRIWAAKNGHAKPSWAAQLEAFQQMCHDRLVDGEAEYGNRSFSAEQTSDGEVVDEILQELADVANWSFVLWVRVSALREERGGDWDLPHDPHDRDGVDD